MNYGLGNGHCWVIGHQHSTTGMTMQSKELCGKTTLILNQGNKSKSYQYKAPLCKDPNTMKLDLVT